MPNETPAAETPRPTFHPIRTLIFVGSALLAGVVVRLITNALF
jgi:hypothetical protein